MVIVDHAHMQSFWSPTAWPLSLPGSLCCQSIAGSGLLLLHSKLKVPACMTNICGFASINSRDAAQRFVSDLLGFITKNSAALLIAQWFLAAYDYRWEIRASL